MSPRFCDWTGLLALLNNMIDVFEYEVDENGNSGGKNVRVVLTQKLFLIHIYLLLQRFD